MNGLITLSMGEIWVRFFVPVQNVCYLHDPVMGDIRCPNQETYGYVEKGYSNVLTTNSMGFHDVERSQDKQPGTFRILYIGDSLTSGVGVPVKSTIPSLVEKMLIECLTFDQMEVWNMAPAEDSTVAQLLTFQNIGVDCEPDMVVCHFMSDFSDNIFETHQRTRSPYFKLTDQGILEFVPPTPVDLTTPVERLKRNSILVRLLASKLLTSSFFKDLISLKKSLDEMSAQVKKTIIRQKVEQVTASLHRSEDINLLTEKAWPVTLAMLKLFKNKADRAGARFVLVDGNRFLPNTAGDYKNTDMELFCRKEHIDYIPVFEEYHYIKENDPMNVYFFKDGHPKNKGNEYLAHAIAEKMAALVKDEINVRKL